MCWPGRCARLRIRRTGSNARPDVLAWLPIRFFVVVQIEVRRVFVIGLR
jgi:hypothetical protein